jgi:tetratricopeptide (TPR) repeat protein
MDEPKPFVSVTPQWRPSKRLRKLASMAPIALVVIVLLSFIGSRVYQTHKLSSTLKQATTDMNHNQYSQAVTELQNVSGYARSKQQKLQLYNELTEATASNGDLQQAIHYYTLKHQLDPSSVGADANEMANLYSRINQNQLAIAQYKLAVQYYKSQLVHMTDVHKIAYVNGEIDYDNNNIASLGGQQ